MATPLKALILEDQASDAALTTASLSSEGFEGSWQIVANEPDYRAALSPDLDVILADYHLPGFDGLKALHILQEQKLDVPFIILSGALGDELAAECIKRGADDCLLKDRLARLGIAITEAIERKRMRRQQQQAEAALREKTAELEESEQRHRLILDSVADAIVVTVGDKREYVNNAYLKILGLTDASKVVGWSLTEFIVPEDLALVSERTLARQRGEAVPGTYEYRLRRADGGTRLVETSAVPFTWKGQPASLAVLRDVTERKQAQEALAQRVRELSALTRMSQQNVDESQQVNLFYREIIARLDRLSPRSKALPEISALVDWARSHRPPEPLV